MLRSSRCFFFSIEHPLDAFGGRPVLKIPAGYCHVWGVTKRVYPDPEKTGPVEEEALCGPADFFISWEQMSDGLFSPVLNTEYFGRRTKVLYARPEQEENTLIIAVADDSEDPFNCWELHTSIPLTREETPPT